MIEPKSLLMPLSTSGHVSERLEGALSIARFFNAHLEVLHAQVSPRQFIPEGIVGMPSKLVRELEAVAGKFSESESSELRSTFALLCEQLDVKLSQPLINGEATARWEEINGLRSELVAERGKVADLIIIPKSKTGQSTATFEAAIMRSGKPVMLVPRTMTRFKANKVLIAWNGSTEGARAITHALPVLQKTTQVVVATSTSMSYRKPDVGELAEYLRCHGVNSRAMSFDNSQCSTGEALLDLASSLGSELLVMGAYTHRRLREQIFGGVTQHVLANAELPIFMMH